MTKTFRGRLLASTLLVAAAASPAAAQVTAQTPADSTAAQAAQENTVSPQTPTTDQPATTGEIVVTGTLIRNPNLTSSTPVNVVSESEITKRVPNNAEELLRSLPGVTPSVGTQVNNGANGTNTVDLRGLGSQRNLVLLDGNRLVPSLANGAVDLNVIPLALIQRVDLLTGGASTTYGADAVSGVVNFITRSDFTGLDARTSYKLTERGDGAAFRADVTVGGNFADDRGNAVLSIGYTEIDPVYQIRDFSLFGVSSTNGRASGASFTSVPTTISFATADLQLDPSATTLVPQYQGFNFNPYNIFQTPLKRKSAYAAANYEVSDGIEVYARGLFSQNSIQQIIAPSGVFGLPLTAPANNPYLTAGVRGQICGQNFAGQTAAAAAAAAGTNPNPVLAAALAADAARYTPANCGAQIGTTPFAAPTFTPAGALISAGTPGNGLDLPGVYRRLVELGPRVSNFENNLYDGRIGARFDVTSSINLDVNASYGRSEQTQTQSGYVLNSRVQQALGANNTTTCTVTNGGCVPLNLFGPSGSITPTQVGFIQGSSSIRVNTELSQVRGVLSGDFGYTLGSASQPVSFAVGAEYRKYTYERLPDARAQDPSELGGAGGAILPFAGGFSVKEAFGELIVPVASGGSFLNELTLEAGARYSSYKIDAVNSPSFDTFTYKGGATYEPFTGLRFRGNYQRAVRAPNIAELFSPVVTGLTNLTADPCAGTAPVGNATLTAVCIAQGAPASSIGTIQNPSAGQANATGGGNTNLRAEKADTLTAGVVIAPRGFIPGLTVSADYYNIVINNAITALTPGDAIANCFGALSATSVACTSIRRNGVNGRLSGPSASTPGLFLPTTNAGHFHTDGIDLTVNYQRQIGDVGLNLNFAGNYTRSLRFKGGATSVDRDCVGYFSANCGPSLGQISPEYSFLQRTTVNVEGASLSLLWRYISPIKYEGTADNFLARGFTAANRNLFSGVIANAGPATSSLAGQTVNFNRIRAYHYFDLTAQFDVTKNFLFTIGAQNLFDVQPPVVGGQAGSTAANSGNTFPSTYDPLGRSFAASARIKF